MFPKLSSTGKAVAAIPLAMGVSFYAGTQNPPERTPLPIQKATETTIRVSPLPEPSRPIDLTVIPPDESQEVAPREETFRSALKWRTVENRPSAAALELADLYVALYNAGALKVRSFPNPENKTPESLLRKNGLFFPRAQIRDFPAALSHLLCDLNARRCERTRKKVDKAALESATGHLNGLDIEISPAKSDWTNRPGEALTLPDYAIEYVMDLGKVQSTSDYFDPTNYKRPEWADCSRYERSCEVLVRDLNELDYGETPSRWGIVPVRRAFVELPIHREDWKHISDLLLDQSHEDAPFRKEVFEQHMERIMVDAVRSGASTPRKDGADGDRSYFDEVTNQLASVIGGQIVPMTRVVYKALEQSLTLEETNRYGAIVDYFPLIDHPYPSGTKPDSKFAQNPVGVLIADGPITDHCDLPPPFSKASTSCEPRMVGRANKSQGDHGNHVMGIVGARRNEVGTLGVNDNVTLRHFDTSGLGNNLATRMTDLKVMLAAKGKDKVVVTNFSGGVVQNIRPKVLWETLTRRPQTLVVGAVDERGIETIDADNCRVFPACFGDYKGEHDSGRIKRNIISVVGLDHEMDAPDVFGTDVTPGSDYGIFFDIAAPGVDIPSLTRSDYGVMTGTSQAAAIVSGAASMVYSAFRETDYYHNTDRDIAAAQVRNRLLYTSDFYKSLRKKVAFGRLNVRRAIALKASQVVLRSDPDAPPVIGELDPKGVSDVVCNYLDEDGIAQSKTINWIDIRRISIPPGMTTRTVVYNTIPSDRFSPVAAIHTCSIRNSDLPLVLWPDDDPGTKIPLSIGLIQDYTSSINIL